MRVGYDREIPMQHRHSKHDRAATAASLRHAVVSPRTSPLSRRKSGVLHSQYRIQIPNRFADARKRWESFRRCGHLRLAIHHRERVPRWSVGSANRRACVGLLMRCETAMARWCSSAAKPVSERPRWSSGSRMRPGTRDASYRGAVVTISRPLRHTDRGAKLSRAQPRQLLPVRLKATTMRRCWRRCRVMSSATP